MTSRKPDTHVGSRPDRSEPERKLKGGVIPKLGPPPNITLRKLKLSAVRNVVAPDAKEDAVAPSHDKRREKVFSSLRSNFAVLARANGLDEEDCREIQERVRRIPADQLLSKDQPEEAKLPKSPPQLWIDRKRSENLSPPQFIRATYAQWLGKGLTRGHLRDLDKSLYQAYANWIHRYPDDTVTELPSQTTEIEELIERLSEFATLDELRRVGLTLQTRRHRLKL